MFARPSLWPVHGRLLINRTRADGVPHSVLAKAPVVLRCCFARRTPVIRCQPRSTLGVRYGTRGGGWRDRPIDAALICFSATICTFKSVVALFLEGNPFATLGEIRQTEGVGVETS
jgi:hypothetical protein